MFHFWFPFVQKVETCWEEKENFRLSEGVMDIPFVEKRRIRLLSYVMDMLEMTGGIFVDFTTPLVEGNDLVDPTMKNFARLHVKGQAGKSLNDMLIKGLF